MKNILSYLNWTFVYAIAGGLFLFLAIEGLVKKEAGIFGWRLMRAFVGDGLKIYEIEKEPTQFWIVTIFYLVLGIIFWIVFFAKNSVEKKTNKYENFLS